MRTIIDFALSHTRMTLLSFLLILIAGAHSYVTIPKESEPDINIPIIYVSIPHEGISPEDAERLLVRPMEQELKTIEGVKEMRSTAYEGGASIVLEFDAGFDADQAIADVREKVDLAKPELPQETDEPTVHEVNFSLFPIVLVILSGDVPERTLVKLARDLQDAVEGIAAVLKAEIIGDREEMVEVLIDPVRVESYGISPQETTAAIARSNLLVAAGAQDTGKGRFTIKVPGLIENVSDIMDLPVKVQGDAVVRLKDVAQVRRTFKDPQSFARVDGKPAVTLEVSKRSGENIIETIDAVRKAVETERATWPEGLRDAVRTDIAQDKSDDIRIMLADLENNVIMAIILVMIVVIGFLGTRSGLLVLFSIPGSFLAGILVIHAMGLTINMVVLFSLILAVGMLVDGAIVVTEYADRKMAEGETRSDAYHLAAQRMSWPVAASTLTTLAAFLPLLFWPGIVGEFMKYLPITLVAVLAASLAMALVFVPSLGRLVGKPGDANPATMKALDARSTMADLEAIGGFTGLYLKVLRGAVRHPAKIVASALVALVAAIGSYAVFGHGVEFFPDVEPKFLKLQIRARGNLSVWEKDVLVRDVEARLPDRGEFQTVYARTGEATRSQDAEDIIGSISIELVDWRQRRKAEAILAEIRSRTDHIPGLFVDVRKEEEGPPVGKPVHVQLASRDPEVLKQAVIKVRGIFEETEGLTNIEDSLPLPGIDWEMRVDRSQAAKFGLDVNTVGNALQMVTTGVKLGEYRPDDSDDELDIRARYPLQYRTIDELAEVRISTAQGAVPISTFVERVAKPRVGTIKRSDGRRVMTVMADVVEGANVDAKVHAIESRLRQAGLPGDVRSTFKGENEEQQKAQDFLSKAFFVAIFLIAIILVTQFNSFYSAALILTAVVMSTIGVFLGLLLMNQPFGIVMAGVGVISLAGIVVNNNIILIDTFDRLREEGQPPLEAILRTGGQRLRPVLLTTGTTVLGLMPMVTRLNIDFLSREVVYNAPSAQWWVQLSTAIAFGLTFATVLTLVVTPSALMLKERFLARCRGAAEGPRTLRKVA